MWGVALKSPLWGAVIKCIFLFTCTWCVPGVTLKQNLPDLSKVEDIDLVAKGAPSVWSVTRRPVTLNKHKHKNYYIGVFWLLNPYYPTSLVSICTIPKNKLE